MPPELKVFGKYRLGKTLGIGSTARVQDILGEDENSKSSESEEPQPGPSGLNYSTKNESENSPPCKRMKLEEEKNQTGKVMKIYDLSKNDWRREERFLTKIKGTHIIRMYDTIKLEDRIGFVLEKMHHTLGTFIDKGMLFSDRETISIIWMVCDAVNSMHRALVTHNDLHAGNVLFNSDGQVKVCDFGKVTFHQTNDETFHHYKKRDIKKIVLLALALKVGRKSYVLRRVESTSEYIMYLRMLTRDESSMFTAFVIRLCATSYTSFDEFLSSDHFQDKLNEEQLSVVFKEKLNNSS